MVLAGGFVMGLGFLCWYACALGLGGGAVALAVGFGTYLFHNTLQTNATQMAPAMRGTGMALFAFCFFNGQAIGVSLADSPTTTAARCRCCSCRRWRCPSSAGLSRARLQRRAQA
jgi:hypothetical protein